jgi:hypothetical protein
MDEAKSWFKRFWSSSERRKGRRKSPLPLVAYFYWNGGVPEPRQVRDVSSTGMYLLTQQRWYPKTLITMTLMRTDKQPDDPDRYLTINVKVVREDAAGVRPFSARTLGGRREHGPPGGGQQGTEPLPSRLASNHYWPIALKLSHSHKPNTHCSSFSGMISRTSTLAG